MAQYWGLVAFDIDGTLTKVTSSWQFAHERLGTWEKARTFQEAYRGGRASFSQWAELDMKLWKGLPVSLFNKLSREIPLVADAKETVMRLREEGFLIGTISSCIPPVSDRLRGELGMDFSVSHSFQLRDGLLDGIKTVVTPSNKHIHLLKTAKLHSIRLDRTAAVGDNWVDVKMLKAAGLGVAFNPQDDKAQSAARISIKGESLRDVADEILKWKKIQG